MKKFMALTLSCGTLALSACSDIPKCSDSMDLDCNVGAYSEERTFRDSAGSTSNINPAAGEPAAPMTEPVPAEAPAAEPVTEVAPAPAPVDTQVMRKADETPAMKSAK